jgi:threonine dehydratase
MTTSHTDATRPPVHAAAPGRLSLERMREAARVIDPVFLDTPQMPADALSAQLGLHLTVKVETLNPVRSFKGRGGSYYWHRRHEDVAVAVCASAGNFGQAMAYGARRFGRRCAVYAATNANPRKLARMRELGAEVRLHGGDFDTAKAEARRFAAASGFPFVEDGDAVEITESYGTIAMELLRGEPPELVLVPVGNGALIAGIGTWLRASAPSIRVVGIVAEGAPAMMLSWQAGRVVETPATATIADGIAVRIPVPVALADMRDTVDEIVAVSDDEIRGAMRVCLDEFGLVAESAGAAAVAAAARHAGRWPGRRVAALITGGNIDPQHQAGLLAGERARA